MATDASSGSFDLPSVAKRSFGRRSGRQVFISLVIQKIIIDGQHGKLRARPATRRARCNRRRKNSAKKMLAGGLEHSDKNKEMTHRFPCQDAYASEPVDQFFSCQVLQLLTLEAASRKRLSLSLSLRSKPLQSKAFEQWHLCS